jgi:hypothetical protein
MAENQFTRPVLAVIDEFRGLQRRTRSKKKTPSFMSERKKFSRNHSAIRDRYEARGINVEKLQRGRHGPS